MSVCDKILTAQVIKLLNIVYIITSAHMPFDYYSFGQKREARDEGEMATNLPLFSKIRNAIHFCEIIFSI